MTNKWSHPEFIPDPRFWNGHLMTMAPLMIRRSFKSFAASSYERLFSVGKNIRLLAHCHYHSKPQEHHTLLLMHGLEGSSQSPYLLGAAQKAFNHGLNVIRLNMRNCGGSMHLTPTLYNAGLSADILAVLHEITERDKLQNVILGGFSLGGNVMLKAAAENALADNLPLKGVAAISPSIDLELAITEIERPKNRVYEEWFLRTLKQKIVQKARLFPELYDVSFLRNIKSIRAFDDRYTAPDGGYENASHYYHTASSVHLLKHINIPIMLVAAEDDPLVPFQSFNSIAGHNKNIQMITSRYGGHGGFIQKGHESVALFDKFWAENRLVSFCLDIRDKSVG
ncbi:MAG: alpha/beta fold hydrolase [Candidatus Obscuribacterales bacterium]|nr:alpha/beta fold hydrolase [Candidatus Obscuribacterales bacterium]